MTAGYRVAARLPALLAVWSPLAAARGARGIIRHAAPARII